MAKDLTKVFEFKVKGTDQLEAVTKYLTAAQLAGQNFFDTLVKFGKIDLAKMVKVSELNGITIKTTTERKKLTEAEKEANKVAKLQKQVVESETGSFKQQEAQLKLNRMAYNKLSEQERNTTKYGKELGKSIKDMSANLRNAKMNIGDFSSNIGNYGTKVIDFVSKIGLATLALSSIGTVIKGAIKIIVDFEQENANLASILGKSTQEIQGLTRDAERLGAATEYTASEVTKLQIELAKLGFKQNQIKDMTESVLMFSTAVGADLPEAAALAGAALRMFDLKTEETERVVSVLAVGTTNSALSFSYLQNSLSTVGPVAKSFGFTIEDTTALLGSLANAGFDASSAATATRNILLNLADANGKLAKQLGEPVKSIPQLVSALKKLQASGIDLAGTLELTDKRSVAAFNAFMSGADSLGQLRNELDNVDGKLKEMHDKRMNTVEGKTKLLTSAWEGLMLSFSKSTGVMAKVVGGLTDILNALNRLMKEPVSDEELVEEGLNDIATSIDNHVQDYLSKIDLFRKQLNKPELSTDDVIAMALADHSEQIEKQIDVYKSNVAQANKALDEQKQKVFNAMTGLGYSAEEANKSIEEMLKLPYDELSMYRSKAFSEAQKSVEDAERLLKNYQAATTNAVESYKARKEVEKQEEAAEQARRKAEEERTKAEERQKASDKAKKIYEQANRDKKTREDANEKIIEAVKRLQQAVTDAELETMDEGLDKKIAKQKESVNKQIASLNSSELKDVKSIDEAKNLKGQTPEQIQQLEAQKLQIQQSYEQARTLAVQNGNNARLNIIKNASDEELKQVNVTSDLYAAAQTELVNRNEKAVAEEVFDVVEGEEQKRLEFQKTQNESLANAQQTYEVQKQIILSTETDEGKKNKALIQNELTLRKAKIDTYTAELNYLASIGQIDSVQYKNTLENLKKIQTEVNGFEQGNTGVDTEGNVKEKSFWAKHFALSDQDKQQLIQQATELAGQIGSALIDSAKAANERKLANEKKEIDSEYKIYSKLLDSKRDKGLISERKYQEELEKLEEEKNAKEQEAEKAAFEKDKELRKKQALMDLATGIVKIWSQSGINWVLGAAMSAALTATTALQIAAINKEKYAKGGIMNNANKMAVVEGRSHAQGGHQIYLDNKPIGEIEGGELLAVVNKKDTRRLAALSNLNSIHGRKFADGGIMNSPIPSPAPYYSGNDSSNAMMIKMHEDTVAMVTALSNRIDNLKVYVAESDITTTQADVRKTEVKATF